MKKVIISLVCAVVVFAIKYFVDYNRLVSEQPQNGVLPNNFTSFPPTSAWMSALPWAVIVFVAVFLGLWIFLKK